MFDDHIDLVTSQDGENITPFDHEVVVSGLYDFSTDREALEDTIYRTLKSVMEDPEARDQDRIKAADTARDILGLTQKNNQTTVIAQNAQINQQIAQNPALAKALSPMVSGMKSLIDAKDSGVKSVKGGAGS